MVLSNDVFVAHLIVSVPFNLFCFIVSSIDIFNTILPFQDIQRKA